MEKERDRESWKSDFLSQHKSITLSLADFLYLPATSATSVNLYSGDFNCGALASDVALDFVSLARCYFSHNCLASHRKEVIKPSAMTHALS